MKKLFITLAVFLIAMMAFVPTMFAEEFTTNFHYPTKIVYDEGTKTMTITYDGAGGWCELMPVTNKDGQTAYNYDIQNFMDKYRTEVEHIEVGAFGKIQIVDIMDDSKVYVDGAKLFAGMTALKSVHFAEGQRITVGNAGMGIFEGCTSLTTVWFGADTNKIEGCANFTGCNIKDNDNYKARNNFPRNLFKGCESLKSVIYTENPNETVLLASTFEGCTSLEKIKIGDNIKMASAALFANHKFENIKTGAEIATLPDPDGGSDNPSSGDSGSTTPTPSTEFKPEGATVWGHSTGEYNKKIVINTYWAYYDDTKTLEFTSLTTDYNETGAMSNCDDTNWSEYKDVIEHIIVGDNIAKVSGNSFIEYPALKDVRLGKDVAQIDDDAFLNCKNLTTIWRNGRDRVEGRADFRGFSRFCDALIGTSVSEIVLPETLSTLELNMPMSLKTAYYTNFTEELRAHAEANLYNLVNINNPEEKYEYYVYIDPTLPYCGERAVFDFDEATGTLTVHGAGPIGDIVNYHGGGSKTQPWFSIRQNIKHIVITERITAIGKYAFAGCKNVETVQLPSFDGFVIGNAAFESCENMKSIYLAGSEPIEGTIDVRNVHSLESWTFAYNYLIANAVINEKVEKIGNSVFSDNTNLKNIYGTPGSFAESYAETNGFNFYDISSATPEAIKCNPPETSGEESTTDEPVTTAPVTTEAPESTSATQDTAVNGPSFVKDDETNDTADKADGGFPVAVIIAVAAAAVVVIAVVVVILLKKNQRNK